MICKGYKEFGFVIWEKGMGWGKMGRICIARIVFVFLLKVFFSVFCMVV